MNVRLLRSILEGVEQGRIPAATAQRTLGQNPQAITALNFLRGLGREGMDIFGQQSGALARIPGRAYGVPDLGVPQGGMRRVAGLPEVRISERPSALVPSPRGELDFPGMFRRSGAEVELAALGPVPAGTSFVTSRGVGPDVPGMGFPTQPNVSSMVPGAGPTVLDPLASEFVIRGGRVLDPSIEELVYRSPGAYRTQRASSAQSQPYERGGPITRYEPQRPGALVATGEVIEDFNRYPQTSRFAVSPPPDTSPRGFGFEPGVIPFSEEAIRNALVGGVRTGNLNEMLKTLGVGSAAAVGGALLGRFLGMGRREEAAPSAQIPLPGTTPTVTPPAVIPQPGQPTGGTESAPGSPVPPSPSGQVILETPGDRDEALREQVQQYTGEKMRTVRPGGKEVKGSNQLAQAYADQAEFGRQNMDMIVNKLGLTGNMEVWARSNPLPAARLFLQTEAKRMQRMDANQRTTFPSPTETQPRGLSQQSPSIQGRMVNTTLGSDFERNRLGSIAFNTKREVSPSQGAYDLAQSLTPLAQPTLMNPDQYGIQTEARQAQLRDLIFQQYGGM